MARAKQIDKASALLEDKEFCVLTGAGMSTDSGIPDYRGMGSAPKKPLNFGPFIKSEDYRKEFWIDGYRDWRDFSPAEPNDGHLIIGDFQKYGLVNGVITQNVDGLHWVDDHQVVAQLHGNMYTTSCLNCKEIYATSYIIEKLELGNPSLLTGDVDREHFWVPNCEVCTGIIKPDVVFFGESLPIDEFSLAMEIAEDAEAMIIAGTSLKVGTPLTFVDMMIEKKKPIIVINKGRTLVDSVATVKINMGITEALSRIAEKIDSPLYI